MDFSPVPVQVERLPSPGTTLQQHQRQAARKAAEDFEAVFVAQMMEPMFQGLKTDGMFGGGQGEAVFRSLMIQEVGKEVAKGGGIGIADSVYGEMLKMQGLRNDPVTSPVQTAAASMGA